VTSAVAVLASAASFTLTDREVQQQSAKEMKPQSELDGAFIMKEFSEQPFELNLQLESHPTAVAAAVEPKVCISVGVQVPESQPIFLFDETQSCVPSPVANGQISISDTENGGLQH